MGQLRDRDTIDEIEVTSEMIDAGVAAFSGPHPWSDPYPSEVVERVYRAMLLVHRRQSSAPEKRDRPQDEFLDGRTLSFKTLEHGGEFPDTMPQAINVTDNQARSHIYVPLKYNKNY